MGIPQCLSLGSWPCHTWSSTTPTLVCKCIVFSRRWCVWRALRGKNPAVAVSLLLEFLLQPLAHPLAAFGHDFHFDFAQRARGILIRVHGPFAGGCFCFSDEEPITIPAH